MSCGDSGEVLVMVSTTAAAAVTAEAEIEQWHEERLLRPWRPRWTRFREWTRVRDRNRVPVVGTGSDTRNRLPGKYTSVGAATKRFTNC